jgi:hypothetical protein
MWKTRQAKEHWHGADLEVMTVMVMLYVVIKVQSASL